MNSSLRRMNLVTQASARSESVFTMNIMMILTDDQTRMKMKKNLLLIVPSLQQGGFQRVCVRTALLLKDSFHVTIAIFNGEDRAFDVGDIPVINLDIKSKPGKLAKILNVLKRINRLKQLKRQLNIDIAYSFGTTANLSNSLSKTGEWNWAGLRSYVDVDAFEMKIICKKADKLISCSKLIENVIKQRFHVKDIETVYNPFDIEELAQLSCQDTEDIEPFNHVEDHKIIMTMGREDNLKGYWHLLKSFALTLKTCPDTRLVFMGRGEFVPYKKLAEELNIQDKVYFIGAKKNPFAYLKKAHCYVLSSVHEGFPNALVEAMAVGLPVISTNCKSGPAEILCEDMQQATDLHQLMKADYGILVPDMTEQPDFDANTVEDEEKILAQAMIDMLTDEELYNSYREKALQRAKDFSTEKYIDRLVQISETR